MNASCLKPTFLLIWSCHKQNKDGEITTHRPKKGMCMFKEDNGNRSIWGAGCQYQILDNVLILVSNFGFSFMCRF
jgi:hypothetical protein